MVALAPTSLLHFLVCLLPDNPLPFPLLGVIALVFSYALLSNLVVDFICPADFIDPSLSVSDGEEGDFPPGMSLEELEEMPCFEYGEGIGPMVIGSGCCAICLDGFEGGERCRVFPVCNHVFHSTCVDLWLSRRVTCPTCRSPFRSSCIV